MDWNIFFEVGQCVLSVLAAVFARKAYKNVGERK